MFILMVTSLQEPSVQQIARSDMAGARPLRCATAKTGVGSDRQER